MVVFASTILVSAFLLFQVQPLICKYILPWFGGSPAVWTTCMLFFQLVLFGGYAYAHLLTRFFAPRTQGLIHLLLLALAAALTFPSISPDVGWKPIDSSHPTGRILGLLAVSVGLPYFVLSTTGPLVQAWFARAWPERSPYRLYALSNLGSLGALITYPFLFEPAFGSDTQAGMWTVAFALFAVLCGVCAIWIFRSRPALRVADQPVTLSAADIAPTATRRLLWLFLPACASLMLLATTNYVCQDVAVIPFLWVVPLSLYLLTFIICFDHPRWYRPAGTSALAMVSIVLAAGAAYPLLKSVGIHSNYLHELFLNFTAMFLACMVSHGQLVRLRPTSRHLTEYYLLISAGGALGGIFVSLIAPQIFNTHFEWTLGLTASILVAALVLLQHSPRWLAWIASFDRQLRKCVIGTVVLLLAIGAFGFISWLIADPAAEAGAIYRGRNFYGTVSVWELDADSPGMRYRSFVSGSTPHGRQFVDLEKRRIPISYFAPHTGMGRTLTYFQDRTNTRVGVIGMGVGVVATYARPGHYYRFYEINEQVEQIARKQFTFLEDCLGKCDVVLTDGRLALEHELAANGSQHFNVLALDAFSGDAPPVHLLTDEAFAIYMQHLEPDGVIVVNITNRYLDLAPVIRTVAKKYGLETTRIITDQDREHLLYHTDFMMLSRNKDFLAANPPVLLAEYVEPDREVPLWTDKYSNLFGILKR